MLKPSIICVAAVTSENSSGEILANSRTCDMRALAFSLFPNKVSIAVSAAWNSPRTRIISAPNAFSTPVPPITAKAFFQEIAIPLLLSTISLALSL